MTDYLQRNKYNLATLDFVIYNNNTYLPNQADRGGALADIYRPNETITTLRPVMIFLHGGGFSSGNRGDTDTAAIATTFAGTGWKVLSIDYRYVGDWTVVFPAVDTRAAVRWVKANAVAYGFNTDVIVVGGSSAGAYGGIYSICRDDVEQHNNAVINTAAQDAFFGNSRPNGFIGFWGPYMTRTYGESIRMDATHITQGAYIANGIAAGRLDISCFNHGTRDSFEYSNSSNYCCEVRRRGLSPRTQLNIYDGDHVDANSWINTGAADRSLRFLKTCYSLPD